MSKKDKQERKDLTEHKIPFVLRDLEMAFNSATRERNSLDRLKQWQVLITLSLTTLLINNTDINAYYSIVTLVINLAIAYLEVGIRWNFYLIGAKTGQQERLLEVKDCKSFEQNIIDWDFGIGATSYYRKKILKINLIKKWTIMIKNIIWKRSFILWYLLFSLISVLPILIHEIKINWP